MIFGTGLGLHRNKRAIGGIPKGMTLDLNAEVNVTGAPITSWQDANGGPTFSAFNSPTLANNIFGDKPGVRLNGTTQYFTGPVAGTYPPSGGITAFVVFQFEKSPSPIFTNGRIFSATDAPGTNTCSWALTGTSGGQVNDINVGASGTTVFTSFDTPLIHAFRIDPGNEKIDIWQNNFPGLRNGYFSDENYEPGAHPWNIGRDPERLGSYFFQGWIGRILVYEEIFSDSKILSTGRALASTYGISLADPPGQLAKYNTDQVTTSGGNVTLLPDQLGNSNYDFDAPVGKEPELVEDVVGSKDGILFEYANEKFLRNVEQLTFDGDNCTLFFVLKVNSLGSLTNRYFFGGVKTSTSDGDIQVRHHRRNAYDFDSDTSGVGIVERSLNPALIVWTPIDGSQLFSLANGRLFASPDGMTQADVSDRFHIGNLIASTGDGSTASFPDQTPDGYFFSMDVWDRKMSKHEIDSISNKRASAYGIVLRKLGTMKEGFKFYSDIGINEVSGEVRFWKSMYGDNPELFGFAVAQRPAVISSGIGDRDIVRFDGVDNVLRAKSNKSILNNTENVTFYVVVNAVGGNQTLVSIYNGTTDNRSFIINTDGILTSPVGVSGSTASVNFLRPVVGEFHVLTFSKVGTTGRVYVDGYEDNSGALTAIFQTGEPLRIGANGGASINDTFNELDGDLAHIGQFNGVWNSSDHDFIMSQLFDRFFDRPGGIISSFESHLEVTVDGSNRVTTWADNWNQNDLTPVATFQGPLLVDNVQGGYPALRFNGVDTVLENALYSNSLPATIVVVGKINDMSIDAGGGSHPFVDFDGGTRFLFDVRRVNGSYRINSNLSVTSEFPADEQFHVFIVISDGSSSKLFVDGQLVMSGNAGTDTTIDHLYVGSNFTQASSAFLNGDILMIRQHNIVFSDDQAQRYSKKLLWQYQIHPTPFDRVLQLDAAFGVTGDPVTAWDSAVGGHSFTNGPDGSPDFVPSVVNDLPAIQFDGVDDGLTEFTGPVININSATVFIVSQKLTLAGSSQFMFAGKATNASTQGRIYLNVNASDDFVANSDSGSVTNAADTDVHVHAFYGGADGDIHYEIDGVEIGTFVDPVQTDTDRFSIGCLIQSSGSGASSNEWDGYVMAGVVFGRILTGQERTIWTNILINRWT